MSVILTVEDEFFISEYCDHNCLRFRLMGEDEETRFDGSRPATLHNGAISTDFPTVLEAIMAWHGLRPEQAQRASIRIIGGELYEAAQIPKLLNGSKRMGD
jgi:hypothetical protein